MAHQFSLISFKLCPFVQRSTITLEEKGVPYAIRYIELDDKPSWFLDLSPLGKVPVLEVDGETVLFESAVINEFLDEVAGDERLLPAEPLPRARDRAWIEFASAINVDSWRYSLAPEEAQARDLAGAVRDKLGRLEREVEGPLWHGNTFSSVDAAFAPGLQRIHWMDAIMPPDDRLLPGFARVAAWTDALVQRPSVQRSTVPEIETLFHEYLAKPRGTPAKVSWVGQHVPATS